MRMGEEGSCPGWYRLSESQTLGSPGLGGSAWLIKVSDPCWRLSSRSMNGALAFARTGCAEVRAVESGKENIGLRLSGMTGCPNERSVEGEKENDGLRFSAVSGCTGVKMVE